MRPWQILLLILVLGFFAFTSGWKVLYVLTYVLLALFILSWFWAHYSLRWLVFRRTYKGTTLCLSEDRTRREHPLYPTRRDSALRLSVDYNTRRESTLPSTRRDSA